MRTIFTAALILGSIIFVTAPPVMADETGFASMHDQRRERGKLCMTDHWHSGTGSGRTKQAALRAAILSYREFTAFEYGTTWARWSKAGGRKVSYTKESGGWFASVEARPCK